MKTKNALWFLTAICALSQLAFADAPADLARIRYDNQCVTIDGKDIFLYSGTFHYFRCPKALWPERFQKMKDAGLNSVETYIAWNWHEQQPPSGLDDFSKMNMTDLTDWLDMAINRFGFYVILRPGPYICAEWDGGGYPQWLVTKKPAGAPAHWLRGDDPAYLAWCKHWYNAAAKATVPFQITHMPAGKPGVIFWQIENEYDYADFPGEVKLHQLQALAHNSRDLGIDVPLITCMTENDLYRKDKYLLDNVIEFRNSYPRFDVGDEARLASLETYQPDKPRMMAELQGGWFSDVGGHLSQDIGLTPQQITHVTLVPWALGYTGTNYYMMFGGTNIGDWGSAWRTTSYDYDAPIRECGGVGGRYFAVQAMANFLKEHGNELVRSQPVEFSASPATDNLTVYLRQGKNGARFLFLMNNQQKDPAAGTVHIAGKGGSINADIAYSLDPFDAKILYLPAGQSDFSKGVWYPRAVTPPARPTNLPQSIAITTARKMIDPGPAPTAWRDLPPWASVEDMGIFDRRFTYYRATLPASTQPDRALMARLPGQDSIIAQLDGQPLDLLSKKRGLVIIPVPANTAAGQLVVLFENGGRENGGYGMNDRCGLINADVKPAIDRPITISNALLKLDGSDPSWQKVSISGRADQVPPDTHGEFKISISLGPEQLSTGNRILAFESLSGNDRSVTFNGHTLSEIDSNRYDLTGLVHTGENILDVTTTAGRRKAGIGEGVDLDPAGETPSSLKWQFAADSAGTVGKWWEESFDDSSWQSAKVPETASPLPATTDLAWYRLNFDLPPASPHLFLPWYLHLKAIDNGFIYLNGHALGRYWDVGPQTDFYLPECWLNFGKPNTVTLSFRSTKTPPQIQEATVSPYAEFAESR